MLLVRPNFIVMLENQFLFASGAHCPCFWGSDPAPLRMFRLLPRLNSVYETAHSDSRTLSYLIRGSKVCRRPINWSSIGSTLDGFVVETHKLTLAFVDKQLRKGDLSASSEVAPDPSKCSSHRRHSCASRTGFLDSCSVPSVRCCLSGQVSTA